MQIIIALILLAIFWRPEKDAKRDEDNVVIFFDVWEDNVPENKHHGLDYQDKPESPYDDAYDDGGPDW